MKDDTISRQAAYDALMAQPLKWDDSSVWESARCQQWTMDMDVIKALPSAQPDIIRCKDCKHYQFADNRAFGMPVKMCEWFGFEDVDDDDFCSRAERREE